MSAHGRGDREIVRHRGFALSALRIVGTSTAFTGPILRRTASDAHAARLNPFFVPLGFPKPDTFTASIILYEKNSSGFECAANGCFIRQSDWDFPLYDFSPPDGGHPYFGRTG
jgi:hypothetical protein